MSYAIDVNLLLYASDTASPHQQTAVRFLKRCAAGRELLCLCWSTVFGYLRIATHPSIFDNPLTPQDAAGNIEALIQLPHVRLLAEEEGYWEIYREVTEGMAVRGNLVPDAHLAAVLVQNGIKLLYTNDSDFKRFSFLRVKNPLDAD